MGDFNFWDWTGRRHVLRKRGEIGVWDIFVPGVGEGDVYKYKLILLGQQQLRRRLATSQNLIEGRPRRLWGTAPTQDQLNRARYLSF